MFELFVSLVATTVAAVVALTSLQRATDQQTLRVSRKGLLGLYAAVGWCVAWCAGFLIVGATTAAVFPAAAALCFVLGHLTGILAYSTTVKPGGDQREKLQQLLAEPTSRPQRREAIRELRKFRDQLVADNARAARSSQRTKRTN